MREVAFPTRELLVDFTRVPPPRVVVVFQVLPVRVVVLEELLVFPPLRVVLKIERPTLLKVEVSVRAGPPFLLDEVVVEFPTRVVVVARVVCLPFLDVVVHLVFPTLVVVVALTETRPPLVVVV